MAKGSSSTWSSHLNLGLPTGLDEHGSHHNHVVCFVIGLGSKLTVIIVSVDRILIIKLTRSFVFGVVTTFLGTEI